MVDYPVLLKSTVQKGFGRGSTELGIPTANMDPECLPKDMELGIYYGWTKLEHDDDVRPSVMSIGWNPFYKNEKIAVEVHVMHKYKEQFYGKGINVAVLGYLRPEKPFDSVDALIAAINEDIRQARENLEKPENSADKYKANL
eukprot:m.29835 g.29835  ORF g.29835 m.29835 type:complete len:143 (-) comp8140_c0_seq1:67-495(-)